MKRPRPAPDGFGSIRSDEVLPLREAARRLGFGSKTIAKAQRDGLGTIVYGRMKYVRGADVLQWFGKLATSKRRSGKHDHNGERIETRAAPAVHSQHGGDAQVER